MKTFFLTNPEKLFSGVFDSLRQSLDAELVVIPPTRKLRRKAVTLAWLVLHELSVFPRILRHGAPRV